MGFSSLKCGKKHERGQAVGEGTPLLRSGVGKAGVKPGEGQLKQFDPVTKSVREGNLPPSRFLTVFVPQTPLAVWGREPLLRIMLLNAQANIYGIIKETNYIDMHLSKYK